MRLKQKLIFFLLLPVAFVLIIVGVAGYLFSEQLILKEWQEGSILKLQWAAHHIDMRMQRPLNWIEAFNTTGDLSRGTEVRSWIIEQIRSVEGVVGVNLEWEAGEPPAPGTAHMERMSRGMHGMQIGMMHFQRARIARVTEPYFDTELGEKRFAVVSELQNESGRPLGRMKVDLRFSYLLENIFDLGWWQSERAYLVDAQGRILAGSGKRMKNEAKLGDRNSAIARKLVNAIQAKDYGTVQGNRHFPRQIAGFYKLEHAPWALVLFAPGREVLAPLLKFRNLYLPAGFGCLLFILCFIQFMAGKAVSRIQKVSRAAEAVSEGDYGAPLSEKGPNDEIGRLIQSFNRMLQGLRERDFIRNTFGRYVDQEIAAELMAKPEAAKLGGKRRHVAILMSDLRGFTSLAESLDPEKTVALLNSYFDRMIQTIQQHKGIIVDFFGDSLLVFFDPLDAAVAPSVRQSLRCAFSMQRQLAIFNKKERSAVFPELRMGIGLHTGEVIVGNIGSESRAKYGIVGSAVNMTSRIQEAAAAGEILVSEAVYTLVPDEVTAGPPRRVELKGIPEHFSLYPVETGPQQL